MLSRTKTVLSLMLLAGVCLVMLQGPHLRFPDEVDYDQLAQSMLAGEGYRNPEGQLTAFRPPGYPFFLWAFYQLGGGIGTVKILQVVSLTATALLLSRLMKKLNLEFQALPALMILAYPVLLFTSATLYPQTLGAFLFLSVLALTFFSPSYLKSVLAGLLLGFLILMIPSFMLTAPLLAFLLLGYPTPAARNKFINVTLFALASLAVVSPWTYRNYRVFEAFVPVSTNSGLNLFLGNSENTTSGSGVNVERGHLLKEMQSLPEPDRDRRYRNLAVEWIQTHPGRALRLYLGKSVHYFHFRNRLETASESGSIQDVILFMTWAPILGLFFIRPLFYKSIPFTSFEKALWVIILSNVFLSAIFFTRIRFRLPFDVLMIFCNACFLERWLKKYTS